MKTITTILWIIGILLAGAEGQIWINFTGLAIFLLSTINMIKQS